MESNQQATQNEMATWYEVQGNYGGKAGWEMVTTADTHEEALKDLADYEENEPQYPHRVRKVRGQA
jgi:hypothetical protein